MAEQSKKRRATLQPVSGQSAKPAAPEPVAAAKPKGRPGTALYVRVPRDVKVAVDVVAATLQVQQNTLVAAVLKEYVSSDRVDELAELVARNAPDTDEE